VLGWGGATRIGVFIENGPINIMYKTHQKIKTFVLIKVTKHKQLPYMVILAQESTTLF
jgi:hypothetical protein